jgi:hypothetical protein
MANGILFVGWIVDTEGQNLNRYPSNSMTSQVAQQRSIQPPSSRQWTFQFPRSDDRVFEASTSAASQGHQYQRPAFPEAETTAWVEDARILNKEASRRYSFNQCITHLYKMSSIFPNLASRSSTQQTAEHTRLNFFLWPSQM